MIRPMIKGPPGGYRFSLPHSRSKTIRVPVEVYDAMVLYMKDKNLRTLGEALWRAVTLGIVVDYRRDNPQLEAMRKLRDTFLKYWRENYNPRVPRSQEELRQMVNNPKKGGKGDSNT